MAFPLSLTSPQVEGGVLLSCDARIEQHADLALGILLHCATTFWLDWSECSVCSNAGMTVLAQGYTLPVACLRSVSVHAFSLMCLPFDAGKGAVYSYDAIGSHERSGYSVQVRYLATHPTVYRNM